jgi:hypothetical protein
VKLLLAATPQASLVVKAAAGVQTAQPLRFAVGGSPAVVSIVPPQHDSGWAIAVSIATLGLFLIAALALIVAMKQLGTVKDERTVKLIEEASSKMEDLLGFFDFAADVRVSREAFSDLYKRLIAARPAELRSQPVDDVGVASRAVLRLIEDDLDCEDPGGRDTLRERKLRDRILAVTNFLERVSTLIEKKVVNGPLFLGSQDYNIVAPYYVLEPILQDLHKHEGFDFDDARTLAVEAQPYLTWLPPDHVLRAATFAEFEKNAKTLRD